jgi:hypothetical protein
VDIFAKKQKKFVVRKAKCRLYRMLRKKQLWESLINRQRWKQMKGPRQPTRVGFCPSVKFLWRRHFVFLAIIT